MTDAELTRAIAVAGVVLGALALFLNWRQYRVQGRIGVRIAFDSRAHLVSHTERYPELIVSFSNPERRTISIQRAGFGVHRWSRREPFDGWDRIVKHGGGGDLISSLGAAVSPFQGGIELEPGSPARSVIAAMHRVRAANFPRTPGWLWCEDSIGGRHWRRLPGGIRRDITSTKVRGIERRGNDDYNHPVIATAELEDADVTPTTELDVRPR